MGITSRETSSRPAFSTNNWLKSFPTAKKLITSRLFLPAVMALSSMLLYYFGVASIPVVERLLAWAVGGAVMGGVVRNNLVLREALGDKTGEIAAISNISAERKDSTDPADAKLVSFLMTARARDVSAWQVNWEAIARGGKCLSVGGTVAKLRIPATEFASVAHLFVDPNQVNLVFNPNITTADIDRCYISDATKRILQQACGKYFLMRPVGGGAMGFVVAGISGQDMVAIKGVNDVTRADLVERLEKGEYANQARGCGEGVVGARDLLRVPSEEYLQVVIWREGIMRQALIEELSSAIKYMSQGEKLTECNKAIRWLTRLSQLNGNDLKATLSDSNIKRCIQICGREMLAGLLVLWELIREPRLIPEALPLLVTDYVPGGVTLANCLGRGLFSPRMAIEIIVRLMNTMDKMWVEGVIHRDLKPENIFLTVEAENPPALAEDRNKSVYVIRESVGDFGLAKHVSMPGRAQAVTRLTIGAVAMGTLDFMPLEQFAGDASVESDVFAAGVIAYLLLTDGAKFPFASNGRRLEDYQPISRQTLGRNFQSWSDEQIVLLNNFFRVILSPTREQRFQGAMPGWSDAIVAFRRLAASLGVTIGSSSRINCLTITQEHIY